MAGNECILIGGVLGGASVALDPRMANRHGLIAGATGTGKTVSLQLLAEGFSRIGVPVFLADIKGDLSGLAKPAQPSDKVRQRIAELAMSNYQPRANPVVFWDLHGVAGHALRATISEVGPLLLSTMLELNDTQTGVLYSCFKLADDNGLLLLDLKDLRAMLSWAGDNARDLGRDYGNLSSSSIGAIQRKLLVLEEQGADRFFGEPAIRLQDLLQTDFSGNGVISVLDVTRLFANAPRLYAAFLLWLLSEIFEQLPEIGDVNKPRLVFFFDEAHLLFENAPRALLDKIEQLVRLIRSKGVGVYFISQSPLDVPQDVLGQLGLRIQHALRAFTPKDQKAVKTAAETFRSNPGLDTAKVITELGIGEALVSVLDARGSPTPVERVLICPPESRIGLLSDEERREHLSRSPFAGRYDQIIDRESAYELLKARAEQVVAAATQAKSEQAAERAAPRARSRQSVTEAMVTSAARAIGSQIGRQIIRGVLGSIMRR
jgi:DNA double-strand break repair helicase HerA and related ATPase